MTEETGERRERERNGEPRERERNDRNDRGGKPRKMKKMVRFFFQSWEKRPTEESGYVGHHQ